MNGKNFANMLIPIWDGQIHVLLTRLKLVSLMSIEKDVWLTTNLKETVFVDYLFIGIKGNEVFIFVHRTPTKEELEELTFNAEDFI